MNSVVVLQARTNSSRLPGKVLLPLNGIPLAVLAAQRAANTGRSLIVATSREASDDAFCALLERHGITFFRGALENVLERVVQSLTSHEDQTLVFCLTADNVFPDGKLLDEMEEDFICRKLEYLRSNGVPSGLPYGMSAEITKLGHLREALRNATSEYDKEHVTPYVIRKFGNHYFMKYSELGMAHFRCTIDCLDDYLGVQQLLAPYENPAQVDFLELVGNLGSVRYQPWTSRPARRLVLGTAQLGSHYGIANKTGMPSFELSQELVKAAIANGVEYLDTARAYGDSEAVVGQALAGGWAGRITLITKLSPLTGQPLDAPGFAIRALVEASLYQSCSLLRCRRLDVVMLHRVSHLTEWDGIVWKSLEEFKREGLIGSLGASVQSPEELMQALAIPEITFIQLPFNLLDWRWDATLATVRKVRQERGVTIHVRGALLQGLLVSNAKSDWNRANESQPERVIGWLETQVGAFNRESRADLCLGYVRTLDWVDGVVVGMETLEQLQSNVRLFARPVMDQPDMESILNSRPRLGESTLNPALWKKGSS